MDRRSVTLAYSRPYKRPALAHQQAYFVLFRHGARKSNLRPGLGAGEWGNRGCYVRHCDGERLWPPSDFVWPEGAWPASESCHADCESLGRSFALNTISSSWNRSILAVWTRSCHAWIACISGLIVRLIDSLESCLGL